MSLKICLSTSNTLVYPQGGHLWVFINWALGLKSCGCDVTWLDVAPPSISTDDLLANLAVLRAALRPFALDTNLVVDFFSEEDSTRRLSEVGLPSLKSLGPFDLLVDLRYDLPQRLFLNFRRKILINIDPGIYEQVLAEGKYPLPSHDLFFSISKSAAKYSARNWIYTPPCVYLDEWPFVQGSSDAPWTSVTHWWNSKGEGFLPFMSIPSKVRARFELASNIGWKEEQDKIRILRFHGP